METVKLIGRISKKGEEYLQTAIHVEGQEQSEFIPVFFKNGLEKKLNYKSVEKKVDKRGVVYSLYEVDAKNVFFPKEEDGSIKRAIITK